MLSKARANAARVSAANVEFRLGEIEALPVPDRSVDVVVSNCVINLSPDKTAVFREVFRALRPGGRLAISDIVASAPLPREISEDPAALAGCIAGAPAVDELRAHLKAAGFEGIHVEINEASRSPIRSWSPDSGAERFVASAASRLPETYRHAITLVELEGLTQAEAARMIGVSLSGMKSRVQRGRRLMRAMFEECCHLTIDVRGRVIEAEQRNGPSCGGNCAPGEPDSAS
jgi:SAM-dependent methyltransferase